MLYTSHLMLVQVTDVWFRVTAAGGLNKTIDLTGMKSSNILQAIQSAQA